VFFQNRRRPRFQVSSCVLVNENNSFFFNLAGEMKKAKQSEVIS
jgi:hypothetical protein